MVLELFLLDFPTSGHHVRVYQRWEERWIGLDLGGTIVVVAALLISSNALLVYRWIMEYLGLIQKSGSDDNDVAGHHRGDALNNTTKGGTIVAGGKIRDPDDTSRSYVKVYKREDSLVRILEPFTRRRQPMSREVRWHVVVDERS